MLVRNGLCALPGQDTFARRDLRVQDGKILSIAECTEPEAGETVLDASGLEVFPGVIDPHVHFDEPGFTHREDFSHGSQAAARGGVTTVIDMPCTSLPPVTSLEALKAKLAAMGSKSVIDFGLYGGVSGNRLEGAIRTDMADLAPEVLGYKAYFISGMETFSAVDHYGFARAVAKAAELGRPMLLHAEDPGIVLPATKAAREHAEIEGREACWQDYVDSRPEAAELVAVASALALSKGREATLHVVHVGTADAAELIGASGASCETCPHYLAFSSQDFEVKGSSLKTAPPVKGPGNADRLWSMLSDGRIAFLASDHAPAPVPEKITGSVWSDYGGIPGSGTLFPYAYSEGYRKGRLTLSALTRACSGAAAKRYGLWGGKGSLEPGKDADLVFVDPNGSYTVKGSQLLSKGIITPFEGMRLSGAIAATFCRGVPAWLDDAWRARLWPSGPAAKPGHGKQLRWGYR